METPTTLGWDDDSCFVVIVSVALFCATLFAYLSHDPTTSSFRGDLVLGHSYRTHSPSHERINCLSSLDFSLESTSPYLPLIGFLGCQSSWGRQVSLPDSHLPNFSPFFFPGGERRTRCLSRFALPLTICSRTVFLFQQIIDCFIGVNFSRLLPPSPTLRRHTSQGWIGSGPSSGPVRPPPKMRSFVLVLQGSMIPHTTRENQESS
ncbi:hypothetical protein BS47DRAFT_533985 [Hydnum rufescens UP504]|uniref:Uncharacterized protein n=1 Tax=Hydnum rufescens UP504 TaxID=1448309 RepID=A0A9P6B706_9AGAM|nr:hypothetical protein BS47DRAFT_533985 [Hydnum rufescens UP504]